MNKDKQRIAIAEVCGWRRPTEAEVAKVWPNEETRDLTDVGGCCFFMVPPSGNIWDGFGDGFPDYLDDLNAMHEAENKLTDEQWDRYLFELLRMRWVGDCLWLDKESKWRDECFPMSWYRSTTQASAAQRAKAFLRTTGRWVEEKAGA